MTFHLEAEKQTHEPTKRRTKRHKVTGILCHFFRLKMLTHGLFKNFGAQILLTFALFYMYVSLFSVPIYQMSFQPGQKKAEYLGKTPTSYQFVGSNDKVCNDSATWAVLCEDLSNRPWTRYSEVRYCQVKPELKRKFRCFGIRILNNRVTSGQTNLRNIRFWERIVDAGKDEL